MPVHAPPRTQWLAARLTMVTQSERGPDSVIAALIRLRAVWSAVRFPEAERYICLLQSLQTGFGDRPASYAVNRGFFSRW